MGALEVFFLVLREAGRDWNVATSPEYGYYGTACEATAEVFSEAEFRAGEEKNQKFIDYTISIR